MQAQQVTGLGGYVFGTNLVFAEICLVPLLRNARRFGCDLAPYPRRLEVAALCQTMDAFAQARPNAQPDFAALGSADTKLSGEFIRSRDTV